MELQEVEQLAKLARLKIDQDHAEQLRTECSKIVALASQLASVDTEGVPAMAHPHEVSQPLRPDEVTESSCKDALMALAPAQEEGLFLVPKVIEEA